MTTANLLKAKNLEGRINYHKRLSNALNDKANTLQGHCNAILRTATEYDMGDEGLAKLEGKEYKDEDDVKGKTKVVFDTYTLSKNSHTGIGTVTFRPKALVSYLKTEAQYHDQEAKKYQRELARL